MQGILERQCLQFGGRLPVATQAQVAVDTGLQSLQARFAQLLDASLPLVEAGHFLGGFPTPQCQRRPEALGRARPRAGVTQSGSVGAQHRELGGVQLAGFDIDDVADRRGPDPPSAFRTEHPPQPRHVVVERGRGRGRWFEPPERRGQLDRRHDLAGVEQQGGEHDLRHALADPGRRGCRVELNRDGAE